MKNNKLLFALLIFISALSINNYSNGSPVFYKPEYNQADSESGFSSGLSGQSLTVNVWGPFGHHKGHYCLIQRMICWHNLSTEFSPLPDYGMAGQALNIILPNCCWNKFQIFQ
ncbi:MAG: hypothetical protein IPL53_08195 [Ignavibacteria bacterium]|nr:hypothetical protein [Ignavibacteria bacterium]